jgi:hypothetical protein
MAVDLNHEAGMKVARPLPVAIGASELPKPVSAAVLEHGPASQAPARDNGSFTLYLLNSTLRI